MAKNEHNKTRTSTSMYTNKKCIQGNMNAMWHPTDVIRPVLLPHSQSITVIAKDNTPRHAHVILVTIKRRTLQWPAQSMDLKSEQARVGHIEAQCACTAAATKSQGAHECYSSDVSFYNSFFTDTSISWGTMYNAVTATSGGHRSTMYWNEIKYDWYWYCRFCF